MVNRVYLIGNLGRDPEVRYTQSGQAVAKFPVATSEKWTDQQGQRQEHTEWHNVVVWGKQAENCARYLSKGRQVFVEGVLRTRSYDDRDGNKRFITEVIARDVRFLGTRGDGPQATDFVPPAGEDSSRDDSPEDDVPF